MPKIHDVCGSTWEWQGVYFKQQKRLVFKIFMANSHKHQIGIGLNYSLLHTQLQVGRMYSTPTKGEDELGEGDGESVDYCCRARAFLFEAKITLNWGQRSKTMN